MFGVVIRRCVYRECRKRLFFLALHLLIGYTFGTVFALCCCDSYSIAKNVWEISRVSVFTFCASSLIPLLISFFAWAFWARLAIYAIALVEASLFAVVVTSLVVYFPVAGWLVAVFLLFSECCSMLLQTLFWRSCLILDRRAVIGQALLYSLLITIVVCIDYFFVSPIFMALIDWI